MSSKLNLKLVNPLLDLHVTENQDESKEIPVHHPFKYCLRFKTAKAQIKCKLSSTNISLRTQDLEKIFHNDAKPSLQTEDNINGLTSALSKVQVREAENSTNLQDIKTTSASLKVQPSNDNTVIPCNGTDNNLNKSLNKNRECLRNNHISSKSYSSNSSKSSRKITTTSLPTQLKKSTMLISSSSLCTYDKKQYCKPPIWKSSTLKSFITSGVGKKIQQTSQFAYDLSRDELKCMSSLKCAMKPPTEQELKVLKAGQRLEYLTQRYTQAPECKYNYPEATSWRIGWMHNQKNS